MTASVLTRSTSEQPAATLTLTRRGRFMLFGLPVLIAVTALLVGVFFASASVVNLAQASSAEISGVEARELTVSSGDTLWSIAARSDADADIQALILQIAELNDLQSSELQPGQVIYVPAQ